MNYHSHRHLVASAAIVVLSIATLVLFSVGVCSGGIVFVLPLAAAALAFWGRGGVGGVKKRARARARLVRHH